MKAVFDADHFIHLIEISSLSLVKYFDEINSTNEIIE